MQGMPSRRARRAAFWEASCRALSWAAASRCASSRTSAASTAACSALAVASASLAAAASACASPCTEQRYRSSLSFTELKYPDTSRALHHSSREHIHAERSSTLCVSLPGCSHNYRKEMCRQLSGQESHGLAQGVVLLRKGCQLRLQGLALLQGASQARLQLRLFRLQRRLPLQGSVPGALHNSVPLSQTPFPQPYPSKVSPETC